MGMVGVGVLLVALMMGVMVLVVVAGGNLEGSSLDNTSQEAATSQEPLGTTSDNSLILIYNSPTLTYPSYTRITSAALGTFTLVYDWTAIDVYDTLKVPNYCTCIYACWTSPECVSASLDMEGGDSNWYCHLSPSNPLERQHVARPDNVYIFWQASIPSALLLGIQSDGLEYMALEMKMIHSNAKQECDKIPGYRLAITKSVQSYNVLQSLATSLGYDVLVDLYRAMGDNEWGDGTLYSDSPMSNEAELDDKGNPKTAFTYTKDKVKGVNAMSSEHYFLCQANPLNVEW
ncbi:hypothetical protein Pcinc_031690 [Petrolisthes cinctipes]|uniref:Uncharacterized protein n=1 Tax=Petrolisthes cinctipes TaxID=88211 RepID=A0AAE1EVP8_PETCI|nr:hypothetical protein Pcinc_031690 [Petrolisthes cinctipes]